MRTSRKARTPSWFRLAPSGPAAVLRHSVQIVPDVTGEVIEVAVQPNALLKAGDVLFRIDPTPYEAQVKSIESQFRLAELRLEQFSQLQRGEAGRAFDVQLHEAEVDQLRAQLTGAKWNLDKTAIRAPANGYVCSETDRPVELACNGPFHWAI